MSRPDARCRSGMRPPGSVDTQAFGYDSMQEMIRIPANSLIERTGSMMILFAFYGRVGSTRLQDVAASKAWQVTRARQLIEPKGGVIVAEYFDIGHSRALPWQRRPQASQPLAALRDPDRGYNAVVIGEPQRAFYGNQSALQGRFRGGRPPYGYRRIGAAEHPNPAKARVAVVCWLRLEAGR